MYVLPAHIYDAADALKDIPLIDFLDEEKMEVERHIGLGITALIGVLGAMVLMIVLSLSVNLKREQ